MPASNERALEKAKTIAADAFIFDLEDAVAPDAKAAARERAVAAVQDRASYGGRVLTIRCNGLDTPWGADDLAAAGAAEPDAVVLTKVTGVAHLEEAAALLPAGTRLWAMIEVPSAIFDARQIAHHPAVSAFVLGTNDLARELRAPLQAGRAALVPHLATAVLAAREAGIAVLDGVFNDVKDPVGFETEARQGLALGFDGKSLVHPGQVEPANAVWAPTDEEIAFSRRVIEAFEEATKAGQGVAVVDGRMVENLHRDNALRTLAMAEAIAALA
jgi:citrate lyase subunit beta/citryl-CoA lyase